MAGTELGTAVGDLELFVLGTRFGLGNRVLFGVVGKQFANQDGLAGQFHLQLVIGAGGDAALFSFLHEDRAQHDFILDLGFEFGCALLLA